MLVSGFFCNAASCHVRRTQNAHSRDRLYLTADSYAFHHTLKQAVQRRGVPCKLYTDQGKPFTNKHTATVQSALLRFLRNEHLTRSTWWQGRLLCSPDVI